MIHPAPPTLAELPLADLSFSRQMNGRNPTPCTVPVIVSRRRTRNGGNAGLIAPRSPPRWRGLRPASGIDSWRSACCFPAGTPALTSAEASAVIRPRAESRQPRPFGRSLHPERTGTSGSGSTCLVAASDQGSYLASAHTLQLPETIRSQSEQGCGERRSIGLVAARHVHLDADVLRRRQRGRPVSRLKVIVCPSRSRVTACHRGPSAAGVSEPK